MAKLPDITFTRGVFGTPSHIEVVIKCRVLKDGLFRGSFPATHMDEMGQFYETGARELTDETLAGLTRQLARFVNWLAEATETTLIVIFYDTGFNGNFSLSGNKLIGPDFTTRNEWQTARMSFLTNATVCVGAKIKRITISKGRDGNRTYTLSDVAAEELGTFGAKLLAYNVGPEIKGRHTNPKDMSRFVEYTEARAAAFIQDIEATYYRAIELRDKLDHLEAINDTI